MSKDLGTVPQELARLRSFVDGYFYSMPGSVTYPAMLERIERVEEAYQQEIGDMLKACEECELWDRK